MVKRKKKKPVSKALRKTAAKPKRISPPELPDEFLVGKEVGGMPVVLVDSTSSETGFEFRQPPVYLKSLKPFPKKEDADKFIAEKFPGDFEVKVFPTSKFYTLGFVVEEDGAIDTEAKRIGGPQKPQSFKQAVSATKRTLDSDLKALERRLTKHDAYAARELRIVEKTLRNERNDIVRGIDRIGARILKFKKAMAKYGV
jgi:hypothetical protein